jgi:hypothetical protein
MLKVPSSLQLFLTFGTEQPVVPKVDENSDFWNKALRRVMATYFSYQSRQQKYSE